MPTPPTIPFPVRVTPLVEREPFEGLQDYKRRCWNAEFEDAMSRIADTPIRNALFALKQLSRL
ncbi:hypothetical protein ACM25O_13240 [Sulfitobacter pontiacus]